MPVRDDPRAFLLPPVAPLTEVLAFHLAEPYVRELPQEDRPTGRPSREEGGLAGRKERQKQLALKMLIPRIQQEQKNIFELLTPVLQAGELSDRWLRNELEKFLPDESEVLDPRQLRIWRQRNLLLYIGKKKPEVQSTAALLLMRRLDRRKERSWLPPKGLAAPQSFVCWRYDAPGLAPVPYELPLVIVGSTVVGPIYKSRPEPGPSPYILSTVWKGASWDDPAWIVLEEGAARWVGSPSEDQLAEWLSTQEIASLAPLSGQTDRIRQALRILADRLQHIPTSSDPT